MMVFVLCCVLVAINILLTFLADFRRSDGVDGGSGMEVPDKLLVADLHTKSECFTGQNSRNLFLIF